MNLWPWKSRHPDAERYRKAVRPRGRDLLEEQTLVVIDAETTGFRIDSDRVLSVAAVEIGRGQIAVGSMRQWLVYQPDAALNEAVTVHGILPAQTASGQPESEMIRQLLPLLAGKVVVGHHIGFDLAMLDRCSRRHLGVRLRNRVIDTARLAMREMAAFHKTGYPNQRPPALDEVCEQLGIETLDRHTAAGDAFTTAEVFLILAARLRRRLGRPVRLRDLPLAH